MSMPRSRPAMRKVSQGRLTNLAVVIVTVVAAVAVDLLVAGIFYNFTHNGRAPALRPDDSRDSSPGSDSYSN